MLLLPALLYTAATDTAVPMPAATSEASTAPAPASHDPAPATPAPLPTSAQRSTPADTPHLLGDWGGLRTALEDIGITPSVQYIAMPAANVSGGTSSRTEYAAQLTLGANANLDKIAGIKGGSFQVLFTNRHGNNINATANLQVLQNPQAIWGAGQIWRLSQAFYRQRIGKVEFKIGRMSTGEEFGHAPCFFESLYFCGIVPGHVAFAYWFNPPVGVWAARVRVEDKLGYTQFAVYENNQRNLLTDHGFYLGTKGATGAILPVERGFTTRLGGDPHRSGLYKIGMWYDTSRTTDLALDAHGGYSALTGQPLAALRGRWGAYVVGRQTVIPARSDGSGALDVFFSGVLADARTNTIRSIVVGGAMLSGVIPGRPRDQIGLAIGRTRVNDRLTGLEELQLAAGTTTRTPQRVEWSSELAYSIAVAPSFSLRPNVQLYHHPGGRSDRADVVVLGVGAFLTL